MQLEILCKSIVVKYKHLRYSIVYNGEKNEKQPKCLSADQINKAWHIQAVECSHYAAIKKS